MNIIIGSDHGGFELKEEIKNYILSKGFQVEDLGTTSLDSCDYPIIVEKVAKKVQNTANLGVLICGTGIGVSIVANKFKGIRAALCYDEVTANLSREHNNANILCLGGRTTNNDLAKKIIDIFLSTKYSTEERHIRRINEISKLEKANFK